MTKTQQQIFDELCLIPPLREGWVRIVHRSINRGNTVLNIAKFGLVFNRSAAELNSIRGGSYDRITQMASVYDEKNFWDSLKHDDFYIYDNANYADTKFVFDMPIDEYCFLESLGGRFKGKVDAKYLVAIISNINGTNRNLTMPAEDVSKAQEISKTNLLPKIEPNNTEQMIEEFLNKFPHERHQRIRKVIQEIMQRNKDIFYEAMNKEPKNKDKLLNPMIAQKTSQRL